MSGTKGTSVLCFLALLNWTAVANTGYASHVDTSSEQKTMQQANSVPSFRRESTSSQGTANAFANAIQQLMLLQQQEEERLAQEALKQQQQQQQERNESGLQEALSTRLQETETAFREAVREMKQQLQERDAAIRSLRSSLDGGMQQVNDKLAVLVEKLSLLSKSVDGGYVEVQSLKDDIKKRLMKLDGLIQISLSIEQRQTLPVAMGQLEAKEKRETAIISPLGEDLCKAAFEGRLEDVRRLLDAGADVQYTSPNCYSPLVSAFDIPDQFVNANPDVVSLLLDRGANVNAVEKNYYYPIILAARDMCSQCVALLIAAGADVNVKHISGATALHFAAYKDSEADVRALLAVGADKTAKAWNGFFKDKTPFDAARSDAVRNLLRV